MGRIDWREQEVHGRRRDLDNEDELYFGVAEAVLPIKVPETAIGFEFMQDNRIHVKHADGRYERIPVFSLKEPHTCTGVIAKSCYACFDYVNALSDLTVGYMGAPWEGGRMTEHSQYCVVRNARGRKMLDLLAGKGALDVGDAKPTGGGLPREGLLPGILQPELDLAFGRRQPQERPPRWLAEFLSEAITVLGPRGLDFAKASIDRATLRNIVCARAQGPAGRGRAEPPALPAHARAIEARYPKLVSDMLKQYEGGIVQ